MTQETRPNPDSLLDLVKQDRSVTSRGKLKVFFGASAGVGKTYAMLSEAKRKLIDGVDVVIGVIETHGRTETSSLAEGLPKIPLKNINHRGVHIKEFDLEAAIARKPSIILVDEFAHNNAPNSRHLKRWQDVEELLANGIDVYTTLNVQHLESINDVVAKLTGIIVRETVPDNIFDTADEISLIDLPSDDLLQRLAEGKVYISEGANKRAAENFFKKSNLVALREMALRRTAERVDAEGDLLTSAMGEKEAQLGQKILVCVGHDQTSASVIRHAKRMAIRAKTQWYAIYVETARHEHLNDKAKLAVERNLRLAERMGANIVRISGSNAVEEILNYAHKYGITRIILGHKRQSKLVSIFKGSLYKELVENSEGLEITTFTAEKYSDESFYKNFRQYYFAEPSNYVLAGIILAFATFTALLFRDMTNSDNLAMFYLTAVVLIAAKFGTGPSIMASFAGVAAFNFFFTKPYYSFNFYDNSYYFTFIIMFSASLFVGSLASKLSLQAKQAEKREQEVSTLYSLTKDLSSTRDIENMADIAIVRLQKIYDMEIAVFYLENDQVKIIPEDSVAAELKEESVARWVLQNGQIAGKSTDTLPSAKGIYVPIIAENQTLGVIALIPEPNDYEFDSNDINQIENFASIIASAFQRALRTEDAQKAQVESEREKLRNALLSSVSHDLRTPLASITGAISSILMLKEKLPSQVNEMLGSIHNQASRLAKLVTNLLDATSLESGNIKLNKQPYYISEIIGSVLPRIEESKGRRNIIVEMEEKLPLIEIDGLLIEQVLVNLLDNAIRYTQDYAIIKISAGRDADVLRIVVADDGVGLPEGEENKIFDKFYTKGHRTDGNAGLGLAICKGIIASHGGMIYGKNNKNGGASITFTLPGLSA